MGSLGIHHILRVLAIHERLVATFGDRLHIDANAIAELDGTLNRRPLGITVAQPFNYPLDLGVANLRLIASHAQATFVVAELNLWRQRNDRRHTAATR